MRRSGPRPQPIALKLLRGNPGKRRIPKQKVTPLPGAPRPEWLSPDARTEWERVYPELLRLGIIAQVDMAVLAAYCEAVSDLKRSTQVLEQQGYTQVAGNGTVIPHPAIAMKQGATKRIRDLAAEFGMSPSERGRMAFPGAEEDADDDEKFLDQPGPRPAPPPPPPADPPRARRRGATA